MLRSIAAPGTRIELNKHGRAAMRLEAGGRARMLEILAALILRDGVAQAKLPALHLLRMRAEQGPRTLS